MEHKLFCHKNTYEAWSSENVIKSAGSYMYIQQLELAILMIKESCVNEMFFVA